MLPVAVGTELFEITPEVEKTAEQSSARAKLKAAIYLESTTDQIARQVVESSVSLRQKMDAAEFFYKLSGMASKQAEKAQGSSFKITINLTGAGQSITLGKDDDPLGDIPEHVKYLPVFNSDLATEALDTDVADT